VSSARHRDAKGTEHVIQSVTQQDVDDLARRITEIAADHRADADPASVSVIVLGLDTAQSATGVGCVAGSPAAPH
jgi:4a-hydroxytetrahydrobiopterin dehydratase